MDENLKRIFGATMSDTEFDKLSKFIFEEYGIKMPKTKKIMLQSRLQKRLRDLNVQSYKEYIEFVFSKEGQHEIIHMIDVVSTNKTEFFREAAHFDFMTQVALPEIYGQTAGQKTIKVWSAGCSSGEEPYTLAMVLSEFAHTHAGFNYQILGTDISTRMLKHAATAIYDENRTQIIPMSLKKKYLLRSKDRNKKSVRIVSDLRKKIRFDRLNFMDRFYDIKEVYDIIFCRNVLIYFDRATQESVINKLCMHLRPGGFFFLGHSESITSMNVPLLQIKPTVFRKK